MAFPGHAGRGWPLARWRSLACNPRRVQRVTVLHWPRLARLPRLRLRTKVSVFFALLALVATVSLSTVTYTLARSSLLDQRTSAAESLAVSNARKVFEQLRAGGFTEDQ